MKGSLKNLASDMKRPNKKILGIASVAMLSRASRSNSKSPKSIKKSIGKLPNIYKTIDHEDDYNE